MKGSGRNPRPRARVVLGASLALALVAVTIPSQAQTYTLNNLNSSVQLDTASSAGMFSWKVDGSEQLQQQWFWFRVGSSGAQSDLSAITATPVVTQLFGAGGKQLTALYSNASYSVQVSYSLTGNSPGSGRSAINEGVRISNYTGGDLDFHIFEYSHFLLGGDNANQSVTLHPVTGGSGFDIATQTFGSLSARETMTSAANHGEAALYPQTLNELTTNNGWTLNDVATAGPGDGTFALEWDFLIPTSGSVLISKVKTLTVPEPATLGLVALGLAALVLRRQRRD